MCSSCRVITVHFAMCLQLSVQRVTKEAKDLRECKVMYNLENSILISPNLPLSYYDMRVSNVYNKLTKYICNTYTVILFSRLACARN